MSFRDNLRKGMVDRLQTLFPTIYGSSIDIETENQRFDRVANVPYMQVWFKQSASGRASIGTTMRFNRHNGYFMVACYVPEESGTATLFKIADAVIDCFEATHISLADNSDVTIEVPSMTTGALADGFYYTVVMVPYSVDSVPRQ